MGILTILGSAFMGSALLLTGYVSAPNPNQVLTGVNPNRR